MRLHHGKCVSGDSRIALADGSFIEAASLFESLRNQGKVIREDDSEVIIDVSNGSFNTLSFDKDNLKIKDRKITHIWKLKGGKVVSLKAANGFEIKTTPEHKFITFDGENFRETSAEYLKEGEHLVCGRNLEYNSMNLKDVKSELLLRLSNDYNFYARLNNDFAELLKKKIIEKGISEICKAIQTKFHYKVFYQSCMYHGRYRLADLINLCKMFGVSFEEIYGNIIAINYRSNTRSSIEMKLPSEWHELFDLFYMTGLLFGDGSGIRLTNSNKLIQERFVTICKGFGFSESKIADYGYRAPTIRTGGGKTLLRLLELVFDYPIKQKAGKIRINSFLQRLPKDALAYFLRGYFDTDGGVEWSRRAVSLTSKSGNMIKDLQLILLKFGCMSSIDSNTIYVSGQSAKKFAEQIGFTIEEKRERLKELLKLVKSSKNTDVVPLSIKFLQSVGQEHKNYKTGLIMPTFYSLEKMAASNAMIRKVLEGDVCFIKVKSKNVSEEDFVYDFTVEETHNFISEGMIIHNTTLTDNLVAGAGMISSELVGERMLTWIDEQERERLMTIYGATVTMAHEFEGQKYLINLLDTPGHVDFGADVTQAMRAVDGAVVMVCAVEGIMPQTETVLKQALTERVKPILFINKVDRAIKELKLTPEQLQKRLAAIVVEVNKFIQRHVPPEFKDKWIPRVEDGSVAFGSAYKKWAISVPFMQKSKITFKEIIELCAQEKDEELALKAPMHNVVLDMVITHLPSPLQAQPYRVGKLWKGDINTEVGRQLVNADPNGKLGAVITKIVYDPHAGMISTARIFSGKLTKGQDIYMVRAKRIVKVQQVTTFIAEKRVPVDVVPAGNVVGLVGLAEAIVGETICDPSQPIEEFEAIKHIFEPVVTKSIEPKNPQDLPKLINILKTLGREDPTLKIQINQETGETLVSGLGELHLDAKVERKIREKGVEINVSPPIVVYRETISKPSPVVEGKSPNKHNKFYLSVEPVPEALYKAMITNDVRDMEVKGKNVELIKKFQELGLSKDDSKDVMMIYNHCLLLDTTKGLQYINEAMEHIKTGFREAIDNGPLAKEPVAAVMVKLSDASLHEDAVHRGPAQVIPAVRYGIQQAILKAQATLLEPKQILRIDTPQDYIGNVSGEVSNKRGEIIDVEQEEYSAVITVKLPVAEMFGFESALKSATAGKGFQSMMDVVFERLPNDIKESVIMKIRERKGLSKEVPKAEI